MAPQEAPNGLKLTSLQLPEAELWRVVSRSLGNQSSDAKRCHYRRLSINLQATIYYIVLFRCTVRCVLIASYRPIVIKGKLGI